MYEYINCVSISSSSEDGAACFPETLVTIYQTTRRHIPEENNLHSCRRGNPKFRVSLLLFGSNSQDQDKITEVINYKVIKLPPAIPDAKNFACTLINLQIIFVIRFKNNHFYTLLITNCLFSFHLFRCLYREGSDPTNVTVLRHQIRCNYIY
jgi:hypothetical protein